ncbi:hypothetical protein HYFRA_00003732 [Hymenoscyphus fraxineus]|uniref:Glucose-methanol-choline oxidoreductase N-terminal domain-containing protein n=1 Tax=Hymenoscyphus fraxineus TaxID=746836 RepID=A0A9N9KYJ6_9HELO|nr:hypothetical protein HYFRA_00003732 [Hymenoscyphus fraxineus]
MNYKSAFQCSPLPIPLPISSSINLKTRQFIILNMAAPFSTLSSLEQFLEQDFDFVVVGGGTAGLTVAARLSENPDVQIGVLEAGPSHFGDPLVLMPAAYPKMIGDGRYDWKFRTVPQMLTLSFGGKVYSHGKSIEWSRGKGLGGSSAINYQMYNRGQALDYDDWAKLGNTGWDFESLLPYFKKAEKFIPPPYSTESNIPLESQHDGQFHGSEGPIRTSFSTWRCPIEKEWVAASSTAGENIGLPLDAWSGNHLGTFHGLSTIDRSPGPACATRSYAVSGYLLPNASRPNLHVLTNALVTKLVLAKDLSSVTGVSFRHANQEYTVSVKKEIILAAGVIKSPQILELSGIGDPEILKKAGVQCLIPNPRVGENLQDHPVTGLSYEVVDGEYTLDILQDPQESEKAMMEYMSTRTGPMSSGGSTHCFASFAALATPEEIEEIQDLILNPPPGVKSLPEQARKLLAEGLGKKEDASIQLIFLPVTLNVEGLDEQTAFFTPPEDMKGKQGFTVGAAICRPLSVGSCHIRTANASDDPDIDPGYHSHPADAIILSKAVSLIERICATEPLREKVKCRSFPEKGVELGSEQVRRAFVREYTGTEYHPIGTVAMGKEGEGVVDEGLRVRGIRGVRVVDASVFPLHVGGNIVGSVYAVAEKAADLLKEEWGI